MGRSGGVVVISCDAEIDANEKVIIVQNGGLLNTRGNRLPQGSAIGSTIIIT